MDKVVVYTEIKKSNGKTKLVETELKGKNNYYDNDNIVFYSVEQLKALLDGITNEFHKLAVLLMYETGARVEEVRELKFSDVESSGRIKVLTLKQRKENRIYRYLKVSDKLLSLITLSSFFSIVSGFLPLSFSLRYKTPVKIDNTVATDWTSLSVIKSTISLSNLWARLRFIIKLPFSTADILIFNFLSGNTL